jgi:hypothetical protein
MKLDSKSQIKDDLGGALSVKLKDGKTFEDFCIQNIPNYSPDRFEAIAIRVFYGKEMVITVYALDKSRQEGDNFNPEKMPVKKFKLVSISITTVLSFLEGFNFTLTTGNYPLEDMEVENK